MQNHDGQANAGISPFVRQSSRWPTLGAGLVIVAVGLLPALGGGVAGTPAAAAAASTVGLGTAASFAVLAGSAVTNTGPSKITGDLGVSPGTAITGFPPGMVVGGTAHSADAVALQAQKDLTTAYDDAAGRSKDVTVSDDLAGQTLAPGIYKADSGMSLTGAVVLDGQNDPDAVFIFQATSTLITGSDSTVSLIRGAQPCNVFWQVGSSATLGVGTTFVGSILALISATVNTMSTVVGRVLARGGAVTLDDNTIAPLACAVPQTSSTLAPTSSSSSSTSTTPAPGSSSSSSTGTTLAPASSSSTSPTTGSAPVGATSTTTRVETATTPTTSRPATDILGQTSTTPAGPAPSETLPRSGSPIGMTLLLAAVVLTLGAGATVCGRGTRGNP